MNVGKTLLKTGESLSITGTVRVDVDQWSGLITSLLQQSRDTCMWMVEFLATDGNSCIK